MKGGRGNTLPALRAFGLGRRDQPDGVPTGVALAASTLSLGSVLPRVQDPRNIQYAHVRQSAPSVSLPLQVCTRVIRLNEVAARRIISTLTITVCLLTVAGLIAFFGSRVRFDDFYLEEVRESFVRLFILDGEANVPTWFSSSILLACAMLLAWIAMCQRAAEDRFWRHWTVLAAGFLYMSLDETAVIHEMLIRPTRQLLGFGGVLHFSWVVPAVILVLILAVAFARFIRNLPRGTRNLFLLSGTLFVLGSLGMESVSAFFYTGIGLESVGYGLATTVEEALEMAGIVLFLKALLEYLLRDIQGDPAPCAGDSQSV